MLGELMMCVPDDCGAHGDEQAVLDRLFARVDNRLGVEAIADLVLAEALQ